MPDPQVLYVVTAVVVLALVAWVVAVLTRAGDAPDAAGTGAVPRHRGGAPPPDEQPSSKTIPAEPPAEAAHTKSAAPAPAPTPIETSRGARRRPSCRSTSKRKRSPPGRTRSSS